MPTKGTTYLLIPFLLVAAVFSAILFPGSYSIESINLYTQAITNQYTNWQTPIIPLAWHVLSWITGKYYSLYIIQMLLYWVFMYLLLFKMAPGKISFFIGLIVSYLLLFIPQYIINDTHIAIAWGIGCTIIISLYRNADKNRRLRVIVAGILIAYGAIMRNNNALAAFILFYLLVDLAGRGNYSYLKKIGFSVLLCTATITMGSITTKLLNAQNVYPRYKTMLLDIIGITDRSGTDYVPTEVKQPGYVHDDVMNAYNPATINNFYWPEDNSTPVIANEPNDTLNEIVRRQWWTTVTSQPTHYFENRWAGFMSFIRLTPRVPQDQYWNIPLTTHPNDYNITRNNWPLATAIFAPHFALGKTIFFTPWIWLLLNMLLFIYCVRSYNNKNEPEYRLQILIQLSGIMHILGMLFFYELDLDFRYSYWSMMAVFIGLFHCGYLYTRHKRKTQAV